MGEKRSHTRLTGRDQEGRTIIRFEIQDAIDPRKAEKAAALVDFSPSGAGLWLDEPLELGQTLRFHKVRHNPEFPARGQVIWTAESRDGFRIGIKFI